MKPQSPFHLQTVCGIWTQVQTTSETAQPTQPRTKITFNKLLNEDDNEMHFFPSPQSFFCSFQTERFTLGVGRWTLPGEIQQTSVLTRRLPLIQLAASSRRVSWLALRLWHCVLVCHPGGLPPGNFPSQAIKLLTHLGNASCSLPQLWSIKSLLRILLIYIA